MRMCWKIELYIIQFSVAHDFMFCGEGGMSAAIYLLLNYQDEGTVNGNEKQHSNIIVTEILNLV